MRKTIPVLPSVEIMPCVATIAPSASQTCPKSDRFNPNAPISPFSLLAYSPLYLNGVPADHAEIPLGIKRVAEAATEADDRPQPPHHRTAPVGITRLPATLPPGGNRSHPRNSIITWKEPEELDKEIEPGADGAEWDSLAQHWDYTSAAQRREDIVRVEWEIEGGSGHSAGDDRPRRGKTTIKPVTILVALWPIGAGVPGSRAGSHAEIHGQTRGSLRQALRGYAKTTKIQWFPAE